LLRMGLNAGFDHGGLPSTLQTPQLMDSVLE
jgi:hypothetical protein